jgi:GTP cyclohydrolase II
MKKVSANLPTRYGQFRIHIYQDQHDHVALIKGNVKHHGNVPVRIHSECMTGDVFSSLRCDCKDQLDQSLHLISKQETGIIIYLRQEGRGIGLFNKIKSYDLQEHGLDTVEANNHLGLASDGRNYNAAAYILKELRVRSVQLITNNPQKVLGLEKHGIIVAKQIPIKTEIHQYNKHYLKTKRDKMGHDL